MFSNYPRDSSTVGMVQAWVVQHPQCKCNIFQHPRLPTPPARAPWTVAASRLEQYNDGRAVVVYC